MGANFSRTNKQRVITTRSQLDEEINLILNNENPQPLATNPIDKQHDQLISSFLEIAVGQTIETARRFVETTNWNIDESINLFLLDNNYDPSKYNDDQVAAQSNDETSDDSTTLVTSMYRPRLNLLFEGSFEEAKSTSSRENLWLLVNLQSRTEFASHTLNRDLWSNDTVSETVVSSFVLWQVYDNTVEGQKISTFYKIDSAPPVVLVIDPVTGQKMRMWSGVIEAQSFVEDLSRFLEAGPHEHIASLIRNRYPDTEEHIGSSGNNNDHVPTPSWGEEFENEETWSSSNNNDHIVGPSWGSEFEESAEAKEEENGLEFPDMAEEDYEFEESEEAKEEEETWLEFPDLTEEPKGDCDRTVVCSLCVRFPDGRRKQRRFLKSEPVQLLWSFCYSHMEGFERNAFKLVQAIPGDSKILDYGVNATFEESGLANSIISVTWE